MMRPKLAFIYVDGVETQERRGVEELGCKTRV